MSLFPYGNIIAQLQFSSFADWLHYNQYGCGCIVSRVNKSVVLS